MSAVRRLGRLIARQQGLVTRDQALAHGMSPSAIDRKLATGEWVRVYRGVYRAATAPVTWLQDLLAVCLRKPGEVWVSHRAAAAIWTLDDCEPGLLEVTTTSGLRPRDSVVVHRVKDMPSRDVTRIGSIPVTTVHRTLIDLGAVLLPDEVEIAFESALRRGISDPDRILRRLDAVDWRGHPGPAAIRAVIHRHDGRPTGSALEIKFLQSLRRHRIPKPDRQHTVRGNDGIIARVDFYFEHVGVVIEVDGRSHHLRRAQWEADLRRRNLLTTRGLRVLHFTHERIYTDPVGMAAEIRLALGRSVL